VLHGVVESHPLFQEGPGRSQFAQMEEDARQMMVGKQEKWYLLGTLGQTQEPLSQLAGCGEFCPYDIHIGQAPEHGEKLRGLPDSLTEFPCPCIGAFDFRCRLPSYVRERRAEGGLQAQLLVRALRFCRKFCSGGREGAVAPVCGGD